MERVIAIGDVHGCLDELNELLGLLEYTPEDHFIFLGDIVNKGPRSHEVVQLVKSLPNVTCVLGNHERRLLKYKKKQDCSALKESDWATIKHFTEDDWAFMLAMPKYLYKKDLNTLFVHGGFLPDVPWEEQSTKVVTRIQVVDSEGKARKRSECIGGIPWEHLWKGPEYVVYGHSPQIEVLQTEWTTNLDTSCVYGGKLTAYILPEKRFVQVKAKKRYSF